MMDEKSQSSHQGVLRGAKASELSLLNEKIINCNEPKMLTQSHFAEIYFYRE